MKKHLISNIAAIAAIALFCCSMAITQSAKAGTLTIVNNSPCDCPPPNTGSGNEYGSKDADGNITVTCEDCGTEDCDGSFTMPAGGPGGGTDTLNFALANYAYSQILMGNDTGSYTGSEPAEGGATATVTWNSTASSSGNFVISESW